MQLNRFNQMFVCIGIGVALLVLYALTTPNSVMLEDDGLFIMASFDAGVAHPPGYPLFTFLGHLFSLLPVGTPAWRMHLLSGLFGALACCVLYLIALRLRLPVWASALAALGWGVSEHFWSQAIITEVYTLNALLCVLTLYFCLRASDGVRIGTPLHSGMLNAAALCFGLGIANHLPLMVLAFPGYALLLLPHWRPLLKHHLLRLLGITLGVAAVFYAWMVWRSWQSDLTFYGPLDLELFINWYLTRSGYSTVDFSPSATLSDTAAFVWMFVRELNASLSIVGTALVGFGLYWARQKKHGRIALSTLVIMFAHSLLIILIRQVDYDDVNISVYRPYPITAYGLWALWVGYGAFALYEVLQSRFNKMATRAIAAGFFLLPAFLLTNNLEANNRGDDTFAHDYALAILNSLPENAIFMSTGDTDTAPIGYFHHVEKVRPDIELTNTQGLVFPNRLFDPVRSKTVDKNRLLKKFARENSHRPLISIGLATPYEDYPSVNNGLYFRFAPPTPGASSEQQLQIDLRLIEFMLSLDVYSNSNDWWIRSTMDKITYRMGQWLGYIIISEDSAPSLLEFADETAKVRQMLNHHYHGLIGIAEVLVRFGNSRKHLQTAEQIMNQADGVMQNKLMQKSRRAWHYYLKGFLAHKNQRTQEAREHFIRSYNFHPIESNPSLNALEQMGVISVQPEN